MRKTVSAPFAAYRLAWRLLLPAVRLLVAADAGMARVPGRGIIPERWRAAERLGYGWGGGEGGCGGTIWFHCASLGEAKGMWALVSALGGSGDILVTANTAEGAACLEERCDALRAAAARVPAQGPPGTSRSIRACVAPFDHPGLVRRFLEVHRVRGLCLYEAELWPHYLAACREAGVPAALVSGRLSPRAFRAYRGFSGAASSLLEGLAFIEAQTVEDAERYSALLGKRRGAGTHVRVGYDYKAAHYLRSFATESMPGGAEARETPLRTRFAFFSIHAEELAWFRTSLPDLMRRFDLAVFPRHMGQVEKFRNELEPLGFALHSRDPYARHLLVDSMGKIGSMIRECHSAFVGGSLAAAGCHNLWEPLLGGLKTYFGPNHANQEPLASRMLSRGLAEVVADPTQIATWSVPDTGIRAAAANLAEESRQEADSALRECAGTIFATFYGTGGLAAGILKPARDLRTQGWNT